jgi:hypothetical protein
MRYALSPLIGRRPALLKPASFEKHALSELDSRRGVGKEA